MCRILAVTKQLTGRNLAMTLAQFGVLADTGLVMRGSPSGHRDGWGIVCYDGGKIVLRAKRPTDASSDQSYAETTTEVGAYAPELSIVHLRKGSVGRLHQENAHPFSFGRWSLCHNGTVFESERIPLSDEMRAALRGTTDTERFFLSLLDAINKRSGSPEDTRAGISETIRYIREHHEYLALNTLFSDGRKLWAVREVNEEHTLVKRAHLLGYFALHVARDAEQRMTALCSERLFVPGSRWQSLPNHCLLELDIPTHTESRYAL